MNNIFSLSAFSQSFNLKELYLRKNQITNLNDILCLKDLQKLKILWLQDNPICDDPNYRTFVIQNLPQIDKLDCEAVGGEERIKLKVESHHSSKRNSDILNHLMDQVQKKSFEKKLGTIQQD